MGSVVPLVCWGTTASFVFLAGWPYLWFAPWEHVLEYLGRTTHRATINVWDFGQKYPDKLVPWHYPFVIFGLTVPVVLHGLGILGLFQSLLNRSEATNAILSANSKGLTSVTNIDTNGGSGEAGMAHQRDMLLLLCTLFPLVVFALPGIAVYDGERLFLTCFPLWAIFVGRGGFMFWVFLRKKTHSKTVAAFICTAILLFTASPLATASPCHLCYYNEVATLLMGGVDRAGLEVDYWGEGITRRLLNRAVDVVPEGELIAIVPTLHQFQAEDYYRQSPILRSHGIKTVEFRENSASQKYILVYRRLADLPAEFSHSGELNGRKMIESRHEAFSPSERAVSSRHSIGLR